MKIFTKKNLILKIVIALVFVILFNFCAPTIIHAEDGDVGGMLFEPVKDLLLTVGDAVVNIMQSLLFGTETSLLKLEHKNEPLGDLGQGILTGIAVIGSVATVVVGVVGAIPTGGMSLAAAGAIAGAILSGVATTVVVGGATYVVSGWVIDEAFIPPTFYLPMYAISPEQIFNNEIPLLDVNFFNPKSDEYYESLESNIPGNVQDTTGNTSNEQPKSSAARLQSTISNWYLALRNLCIVALLSILLYTGIRIIISSSSQDKAKYKQRLMDWLVGMCLLFFLHYIMSFAMTITDMLVNSLSAMNPKLYTEVGTSDNKLSEYYYVYNGENAGKIFDDSEDSYAQVMRDAGVITATEENENVEKFMWPTNLMGKARMEVQIGGNSSEENLLVNEFGYTLIFVALVIYTVLFLFRYLKRLLMLAFLTIIAPFVAMTYPLDKMSDGNAQAFNAWFKEYIYNLLIQPVHLILYTVLIGSAIDLVKDNLLYAIAALGFILQAEKIIRNFFGFSKASTLAGGSALGGALAMQGINQLRKLSGGSKKQKSGGQSGGKDENGKINYNRKPDAGKDINSMIDSEYGEKPHNNQSIIENLEGQYDNQEQSPQQRMLDAYDENYGTDEWNPQERDIMARETENGEGMNYSEEEYRNILRDSGYNEDEIDEMVSNDPRYASNNNTDEMVSNNPKYASTNNSKDETYQYAPTHTEYTYTSNQENKPKEKTHRLKGAAAVLGAGVKYVAPKAARIAIKGTIAGAAGVAGLAAGLVSDDYSNVLKYGAAGLGAGWLAGSGVSAIPEKAKNIDEGIANTLENVASTYTIAAKGEKAEEERQKRIQDMKAMQDKERIAKYKKKLKLSSAKQAREAMRDAQKYRESGITDDDLIIKSMKAEGFGDDKASRERIILAGLAQEVGTSKKELERMKKGLEGRGFTKEQIKTYSDAIKDINDWTF